MRVNYHIWSGVYRCTPAHHAEGRDVNRWGFPTVVVDMALNDWALPFSIHAGGPLLGKPGFTFRIGPVSIGWSKL